MVRLLAQAASARKNQAHLLTAKSEKEKRTIDALREKLDDLERTATSPRPPDSAPAGRCAFTRGVFLTEARPPETTNATAPAPQRWRPEAPKRRAGSPRVSKNVAERAAAAKKASDAAVDGLATAMSSTGLEAKNQDRLLEERFKERSREWHRALPLKFDGLVPGAHVPGGARTPLPPRLRSPRSPRPREPRRRDSGDDAAAPNGGLPTLPAGLAKVEEAASDDAPSIRSSANAGSDDFGEPRGPPYLYHDVFLEVKAMKIRRAGRAEMYRASSV